VFCGLAFILFSIWVLAPVFMRTNYNLRYFEKEIVKQATDVAEDGKIILFTLPCTRSDGDCMLYTFSNLIQILLKDTRYIIDFPTTEKDESVLNCSKLEFQVIEMDPSIEGVNNTIIIGLNGTQFSPRRSQMQCLLDFDQLLVAEMLQQQNFQKVARRNALLDLENQELGTLFKFRIRGMKANGGTKVR
jgi:hypothetical protein